MSYYYQALEANNLVHVCKDGVGYLQYDSPNARFIGTNNLTKGVAIVIMSPFATIVAHITAWRYGMSPEQEVEPVLKEVKELYLLQAQCRSFPEGTAAWLITPRVRGVVSLPEHKRLARRALQELRLRVYDYSYEDVPPRNRRTESGMVTVDFVRGSPRLCLEGRQIAP